MTDKSNIGIFIQDSLEHFQSAKLQNIFEKMTIHKGFLQISSKIKRK